MYVCTGPKAHTSNYEMGRLWSSILSKVPPPVGVNIDFIAPHDISQSRTIYYLGKRARQVVDRLNE